MPTTTSLAQRAVAYRVIQRGTWLFMLALLGALLATEARADEGPTKIVLHPAAAPRPLLKYQLLPTFHERRPGNAVVFYGRVKAEQTLFFTSKEIWKEIYETAEAPLARVAEMTRVRQPHEGALFRNLERAGQCEDCDWQYPVAEDGFATGLPDAQEQREFARMLRADIRWRVAHGDFEGAVHSLKTGYAMARHTADSPVFVSALIGAAISGIMSDCTLEMIQQPDAPSLYWALTYLPQPLFDRRQVFEGEMLTQEAAFPQLTSFDEAIDDPAYWRRQLEELSRAYEEQVCDSDDERAKFRKEVALRVLRGYPLAKEVLIESGRATEEVEAMPASKAILLHSAVLYAEFRDQALACVALPYWQAASSSERFDGRLLQSSRNWESPLPFDKVFPAMHGSRYALMRQDRRIALLRLLEALRLHAAEDTACLPESLDEIQVPLPLDPMTGRRFTYQLRDGVAQITGPPMSGRPFHYEVHLASAGTK